MTNDSVAARGSHERAHQYTLGIAAACGRAATLAPRALHHLLPLTCKLVIN